jgi:hypothetical protein
LQISPGMETVLRKGVEAFFKRPKRHGHIALYYIGLYTVLQLQLVGARHHDLGKLLAVTGSDNNNLNNDNLNEHSNSNNNNINFNDNVLSSLQHAQINHSHENEDLKQEQQHSSAELSQQQPILGQKITQQTPGTDIGSSGAVLSKDDGKYSVLMTLVELTAYLHHTL